jgi:hypothetical protein
MRARAFLHGAAIAAALALSAVAGAGPPSPPTPLPPPQAGREGTSVRGEDARAEPVPRVAARDAAAPAASDLEPFDAATPAALRAANAGRPFVLVFWSTTCEPCVEELPLWVGLARRHPGIAVHLVLLPLSGSGEEADAKRLLAERGAGSLRVAAVRDDVPERVLHAVDPAWRGELPAAWFFDAAHRSERRLGRVEMSWVESWMKAPLTLDPSPPAARRKRNVN